MTPRLLTAVATVASLTAVAAPCPTRASWPTTDWPVTGSLGRASEIAALEEYAFRTIGKDGERNGIRTDGVVIVKGGNIIYERYARGWSANNRHISWSVAKSVSSALIGVAVQKGVVKLEDSICTYLPQYASVGHDANTNPTANGVCDIKVKHVITFGLGVQWQEQYEGGGYQASSVIAMLLGVGHQDQVGFVLSQNQLYPPGTQYIYSTGYAAVASAVAKAALKPNDGPDAFWTQFFDKIGMSRVTFEEDPQGHPLGGSYVYATVRDYAKFGYLYLNDGCWAGERILPENWVAQSTTISDVYKFNHSDSIPNGYMWWVNQPPVAGAALPFKDVPADMYTAIGHWGQYVTVVPSADVVVVRTGDDRKGCPANAVDGKVDGVSCGFDLNTFVSLALQVAK